MLGVAVPPSTGRPGRVRLPMRGSVPLFRRLLHVDNQKRFPTYQANSLYQIANIGRGLASHKDLEQLSVDWKRGIFSQCKSILHLEILENSLYNSFFPAAPVFVK